MNKGARLMVSLSSTGMCKKSKRQQSPSVSCHQAVFESLREGIMDEMIPDEIDCQCWNAGSLKLNPLHECHVLRCALLRWAVLCMLSCAMFHAVHAMPCRLAQLGPASAVVRHSLATAALVNSQGV